MSTPDVTVLGAGIFGLSIAWACAKRGATVRVIERDRIGAGSSGGIVGALAPHVPENWNDKKAFQLDSLLMAQDWWTEIADISGVDPGYARSGRVQPIADDRGLELAQERIAGAARYWQNRAIWEVRRVESFGTWCPASPTRMVIHDTLSARLHPARACAALAAALRAKGGEVLEGTGTCAGRIVEAAGHAGLVELSRSLGRTVGNGVKGQAILLDHDARDLPQLYADGLHIVPHGDGTTAIGSTSEREWQGPDDATDAQLDEIHARAVAAVPALESAEVLARWAGIRPRSKSRAPMLGVHPLRPDRFIANGGFKIGFGMGPKVGEVMADLVLEGTDTIPEGFRPQSCL